MTVLMRQLMILRKAGLPSDVESLIVSISEAMMPSSSLGHDVVGVPMTSRRVTDALDRRRCKQETMPRGYHIHNPIAENEPLERWENEGGRLGKSVYAI